MKNKIKGFTLIELLVVIAIMGVLASIIISSLNRARALARDAVRISEFRQFATALEAFYMEYGKYPCGDAFYAGVHRDDSDSCPFLDGNAGSDPSYEWCDSQHTPDTQCTEYPTFGLKTAGYLGVTDFEDHPYAQKTGGGYLYVYTAMPPDRQQYLLQTKLEANTAAMQNDGGICSLRYEVGNGKTVLELHQGISDSNFRCNPP